MTDTRTISQLEAEGYPWIGCECCKGTVWVPFKMIRDKIPMLSSWTLDELAARMKRQMRQAARTILSREAERRSGVCKELLRWHASSRDFQEDR